MSLELRVPSYCPSCGHSPFNARAAKWRCKRQVPVNAAPSAGADQSARADEVFGQATGSPANLAGMGVKVSTKACDHVNAAGRLRCRGCRTIRRGAGPSRLRRWLSLGLASSRKDERGRGEWEQLCNQPACGEEVPKGFEQEVAGSVCFVGATGVGKSHFLVALEEWWRANLPTGFNLSSSEAMTPKMADDFRAMKLRVRNGKALEGTPPDRMFTFAWHFNTPGAERRPVVAFHDTGGENFRKREQVERAYPFIKHCNAFIIMLDGERLRPAYGGPPPNDPRFQSSDHEDTWRTVKEVLERDRFRDLKHMSVALCVNKLDTLEPVSHGFAKLMDPDRMPRHRRGFDVVRAKAQSDHLIAGLKSGGSDCANLTQQLIGMFPNLMAFPMSTLGAAADGEDLTLRHPKNVESPLLWLLWQFGLVPAV